METYGPQISETYRNSKGLIDFMNKCVKYVSSLDDFSKYCVWRYTIGSASINSRLIFGKLSENAPQWTYLFFLYYRNTFSYSARLVIPKQFKKWSKYFSDPESYRALSLPDRQRFADEVITQYTLLFQKIILKAPKVNGEFHVFKVASKYPALPEKGQPLPADVLQLPFNSTTISPYFNFAPFISPDSDCCLFDIIMPKGSSCLYVPTEYHAYGFEHEIILPHDSIFKVTNIRKTTLNYIDPKTVNIVQLQDKDKIKVGTVYMINEYKPCLNGDCLIQRKQFTVYDCVYKNP